MTTKFPWTSLYRNGAVPSWNHPFVGFFGVMVSFPEFVVLMSIAAPSWEKIVHSESVEGLSNSSLSID